LIDEIDKTNPGFDAFLLRLLEEWTFRGPGGDEIGGDPTKLAVVLTTNGRRKLRPEVLRRCQRVDIPLPEAERLCAIIRQIAGVSIPENVLDLVIRIGNRVRQDDAENAPSPKELALCILDLFALKSAHIKDVQIWREIGTSWLTKSGGSGHINRVTGFNWAKALKKEVMG